ncbi:MAG: site-2 protease family protein, partial [Sphingomonadales bacterium]
PTAKEQGRLSPNPLRHVDPFGTVILPLVLALSGAPVFGWARPVPVRAERLRNPRVQMMLVALAGPAMNFLLALLAAFGLALTGGAEASSFLAANLRNFLMINVFLGVFNLLPVPPFDGGHVVEGLLPRPLAERYRRLNRYAFPVLILLLVVVPMLAPHANIVGRLVMPPFRAIVRLLGAIAGL